MPNGLPSREGRIACGRWVTHGVFRVMRPRSLQSANHPVFSSSFFRILPLGMNDSPPNRLAKLHLIKPTPPQTPTPPPHPPLALPHQRLEALTDASLAFFPQPVPVALANTEFRQDDGDESCGFG